MTWFGNFYRSAIGKKAVMAVTGVILFGWIFLHMVGNLKIYLGTNAAGVPHLNEYAEFLRTMLVPALPETGMLWISRIVLLVCVVLHIWAAYSLTMMNWAARPIGYRDKDFVKATYASRTMRWGGVIILLFVIYHLLHLTTGQLHPDFRRTATGVDVYHNVVSPIGGFGVWWISAIYIIANLALGLHLYHGVWAMFGSLGFSNPRFEGWRRNFATAFAVLITVGNISIPLAVLAGFVR